MYAGDGSHPEDELETDIAIVADSERDGSEYDDTFESPFSSAVLNARRRNRRNALAHIMDEENEDVEPDDDELADEEREDSSDSDDILAILPRNLESEPNSIQPIEQTENGVSAGCSQPGKREQSSPPGTPAAKKIQRDSMDSQSDGDCCLICFEPWCNSGKHKLVALKCGHLFGMSCIERWVRDAKRCPQCNVKARKADIRVLYAKTLRTLDTAELTKATEMYEMERDTRRKKEMELAKTQMQYQMAMSEVNRLKEQLEELKNQQVVSSLPQSAQDSLAVSSSAVKKFAHVKNVMISSGGNCRVMDFHRESLSLAISLPSPHSSFMTGFGLKKFSVVDMKSSQFNILHTKPIKDVRFSTHGSLVLTASQDGTLKITNWNSNSHVHTYKPERQVWCCSWDAANSNVLYCGLNNGVIQCYDIRNTVDVLHSISNPLSKCPIVSMYNIPRQADPDVPGGLLAQTLEGVTFWQEKGNCPSAEYEPHILPLQSGNCAGLQYSDASKQCLVTFRPGRSYQRATHVLCQLKLPASDTDAFSCDVVETYHGGKTHKLLTRNAIMTTESTGDVVCVGDESKSIVNIYEAKSKGRLLQALGTCGPALDILPMRVNDSCFLSTLSDRELRIYEQK